MRDFRSGLAYDRLLDLDDLTPLVPWENPQHFRLFQQNVYCAAKHGRYNKLVEYLSKVPKPWMIYEVLQFTIHDQDHCMTPFIAAVINGHERIVRYLLKFAGIQKFNRGCFWFACYPINQASPLMFAVGENRYDMVKLLIKNQAEIKHPDVATPNPPRISFMDRIMYLNPSTMLLEMYANICLCVIVASNFGQKKILKYLLKHAPVHDCAMNCGSAAIHAAAEGGHIDIINILIEHGVNMEKNVDGMTALLTAADARQPHVVERLMSLPECTRAEKIEAYELLGASFACGHPPYDFVKAFSYLRKGMKERFRMPETIIEKPKGVIIPAYDDREECQNLPELEAIRGHVTVIQMESMAIVERILGPQNQLVPEKIFFTGVMTTTKVADFDKCISLWMHSMRLQETANRPIFNYMESFTELFGHLWLKDIAPPFPVTKEVFEYGLLEMQKIDENATGVYTDHGILEVRDTVINSCVFIAAVMLQIELTAEEEEELRVCIYDFLHLQPVLTNGLTPLHLAVNFDFKRHEENFRFSSLFPNAALCEQLIQCGVNVDVCDKQGNTPLHLCGRYTPITYYKMRDCMQILMENGAHLDFCNKRGQTPRQIAACISAKLFIDEYQLQNMNLKCMVAKAVKKHNIPYWNVLQRDLQHFVDRH